MCTDAQHHEKMLALKKLQTLIEGRAPLDSLVMISATQPYVVNYQDRKHIFILSPNILTLSIEDLGNVTISQATWTNISYSTGMKLYAVGQSTAVPIFVRCTDETVA